MSDKKRCEAKTRNGTPCKRWARPNGRCNLHGGKTPSGIASPHWKHGRYSKYLPQKILSRYQEFVSDPDKLALDDEIAVTDARLSELLENIHVGDNQRVWRDILELFNEFDRVQRKIKYATNDEERRMLVSESFDIIESIRAVAKSGFSEWSVWKEIHEVIEYRRRLVESETRRRVQMSQVITAEQALAYANALAMAVKENVTDQTTLTKIQDAFNRLMQANNMRDLSS